MGIRLQLPKADAHLRFKNTDSGRFRRSIASISASGGFTLGKINEIDLADHDNELHAIFSSFGLPDNLLLGLAEWHYGQANYALALECLSHLTAQTQYLTCSITQKSLEFGYLFTKIGTEIGLFLYLKRCYPCDYDPRISAIT